MSAQEKAAGQRAAWIFTAVLIALLCGANAHLVYVAIASQPDCVPHRRIGERQNSEPFAAATSSCNPSMPSQPLRSDL